jgi:prevent-host-death family protein
VSKRSIPTAIPAYIARTQLGSLLRQVTQKRTRFLITRKGKPTAVLLSATDFDDILEELDPEFQKSLKITANELRAGKGITLEQYLKERLAGRRVG